MEKKNRFEIFVKLCVPTVVWKTKKKNERHTQWAGNGKKMNRLPPTGFEPVTAGCLGNNSDTRPALYHWAKEAIYWNHEDAIYKYHSQCGANTEMRCTNKRQSIAKYSQSSSGSMQTQSSQCLGWNWECAYGRREKCEKTMRHSIKSIKTTHSQMYYWHACRRLCRTVSVLSRDIYPSTIDWLVGWLSHTPYSSVCRIFACVC